MRLKVDESAARPVPGITFTDEQLALLATFWSKDLLQGHTKTLVQLFYMYNQ